MDKVCCGQNQSQPTDAIFRPLTRAWGAKGGDEAGWGGTNRSASIYELSGGDTDIVDKVCCGQNPSQPTDAIFRPLTRAWGAKGCDEARWGRPSLIPSRARAYFEFVHNNYKLSGGGSYFFRLLWSTLFFISTTCSVDR